MAKYRILLLGETGTVLAFETIHAARDAQALEQAHRWIGIVHEVEVWCGSRQVTDVGRSTEADG